MSLHSEAPSTSQTSSTGKRDEEGAISDGQERRDSPLRPPLLSPAITCSGKKSTYKTEGAKKAPTRQDKKAPTRRTRKTPTYYLPCSVVGVISPDALKERLTSHGQHEWTSPVRIGGLMLILQTALQWAKDGIFSMSHELARQYISRNARSKNSQTIAEPLLLLRKIGIIERISKACTYDLKYSAKYRFTEAYSKRQRYLVPLNPKLREKLEHAESRREERLQRKHPFRAPLLADLKRVSLGENSMPILSQLFANEDKRNVTQSIYKAIDQKIHKVSVNPRGQITTSISSTPKELKPTLLLNGKETIQCDISSCHPLLLPILLKGRIDHYLKEGKKDEATRYEPERQRLLAYCNEGDLYQKLAEASNESRTMVKKRFNAALNDKTWRAQKEPSYEAFKREFPLVCGVIEDLKAKDHRNMSKKLQSYTASIINTALLRLQQKAISAIPFVDALMVVKSDEAVCCRIIGEELFNKTGGVRAVVGGVRYDPDAPKCNVLEGQQFQLL